MGDPCGVPPPFLSLAKIRKLIPRFHERSAGTPNVNLWPLGKAHRKVALHTHA